MTDVKSNKYNHLPYFFEGHTSHFLKKDQLTDETENNYPKLLVRDSHHLPEEEQMAHDSTNGTFQVPDDEDVITDFLLAVSSASPEGKNLNADCNFHIKSPKEIETVGVHRVLIDTTAPFESVKAAVSKFGGILDWNVHRLQTVERRKLIEKELGQAREEIPIYQKQYQKTEAAKLKVLKELESTKRLVEELKLNLERTHTEEEQAKQDDDLAKLRVEELEQGIEDEASISTKTQLEVARSRQKAAASELRIVKNELEQLKKDYELLVLERERALKKAEMSVSASKDIEKLVEEMMIELIDVKESLRFAHGDHLEAEEKKLGACANREKVVVNCELELKEAEEEREKLREKILSKKERQRKLETDMAALVELKSELAVYVETKPGLDTEKELVKKQLEEIKGGIEKALLEVNNLKNMEAALKSQIDLERSEISAVRQREERRVALFTSLEGKLSASQAEIFSVQLKVGDRKERMAELPMQLQLAGQDSEQAKTLTQLAREEWQKQKDNWDLAKAEAKAMENKLIEAEKEIEAAKASEKLALAAIDASKVSESDCDNIDKDVITLSLEEYYVLTKKAHKAQENANAMEASVNSQIEIAKVSEKKLLRKLEEVDLEMVAQKEALVVAIHKAEHAKENKVSVEQELRNLRAENEKRRRDYIQVSPNPRLSFENSNVSSSFIDMAHTVVPNSGNPHPHGNGTDVDSGGEVKGSKKKKKSFFPRFFMFLARRKAHASKSK